MKNTRELRNVMLVFLLACTIYMGITNAHAESIYYDNGSDRFFSAVNDDVLWLIDENGIHRKRQGENMVTLGDLDEMMAVDANETGAFILTAVDGYELFHVGHDGKILNTWYIGLEMDHMHSIVVMDGGYIALLSGHYGDSKLYFLNMSTGVVTKAEGLDRLTTVGEYSSNEVVVNCLNARNEIYRVNAETLESEQIAVHDLYPYAICASEKGDIHVLTISCEQYVLSSNGEARLVRSLNLDKEAIYCHSYFEDETLFVNIGNVLYSYETGIEEPQNKSKTITILNAGPYLGDERMRTAIRMFETQYPDYKVNFVAAENEDLILDLMSGANRYDILCLDQNGGYENMLHAGLFENLSDYPLVADTVRENWCYVGAMYNNAGEMLCVPITIMPFVYYLNDEQAEDIELELPVYMSYDELRDVSAAVRQYGLYFIGESSQLTGPIRQYIVTECDWAEGHMDFDTEEFRASLRFWKEMFDADYAYRMEHGADVQKHVIGDEEFFLGENERYNKICKGEFLYAPDFQDRMRAPTHLTGLHLYKYGTQKDIASAFIGCFASAEAQYELNDPYIGIFMPDITKYSNYDAWLQSGDGFTGEGHENWIEFLKNSAISLHMTPITNECIYSMPEYLNGAISEDELIARLNEKADILLNE